MQYRVQTDRGDNNFNLFMVYIRVNTGCIQGHRSERQVLARNFEIGIFDLK
jgi:hypothetical protein